MRCVGFDVRNIVHIIPIPYNQPVIQSAQSKDP
jgi:hypothetical protein